MADPSSRSREASPANIPVPRTLPIGEAEIAVQEETAISGTDVARVADARSHTNAARSGRNDRLRKERSMTRHVKALILVGLVIAWTAPLAHATGDSCPAPCAKPPKAARSVSATTVPRPAGPAALLTATLQKAKKKNLVQVEAMMTTSFYTPGIPSTLQLFADVNGILMEPTTAAPGAVVDCGGGAGVPLGPPSFSCTVAGTWWLDVDANAGTLLTSPAPPLTVTLRGGELFPGAVGAPVDVSLTVRLVKK
jgi:hypothetical protein